METDLFDVGGGSSVCWGLGREAEGCQFKTQHGQDMEVALAAEGPEHQRHQTQLLISGPTDPYSWCPLHSWDRHQPPPLHPQNRQNKPGEVSPTKTFMVHEKMNQVKHVCF